MKTSHQKRIAPLGAAAQGRIVTREQRRIWGRKGALARFGDEVCTRCGRRLYRNNHTHLCRACIRRWGLATLKRRVKTLQELHERRCSDPKCDDPAHLLPYSIPVKPQKPGIILGSKGRIRQHAQSDYILKPVCQTIHLDRVTSGRLFRRARSKSQELGVHVSKSNLIRAALYEWFENHPDSEFFVDAIPGV
jgi:hypothetical protein